MHRHIIAIEHQHAAAEPSTRPGDLHRSLREPARRVRLVAHALAFKSLPILTSRNGREQSPLPVRAPFVRQMQKMCETACPPARFRVTMKGPLASGTRRPEQAAELSFSQKGRV